MIGCSTGERYVRDMRWLESESDMNRESWRGSDEIEVLVLEGQLMKPAPKEFLKALFKNVPVLETEPEQLRDRTAPTFDHTGEGRAFCFGLINGGR